jgi:hypothetical protein
VAAQIKQTVGISPELVVGKRGEFTVWVDEKLIGSKEMADGEIVAAVEHAGA